MASLACMFGPSPDWCVGVSAINLCLPDCTWVEERAFDLRPFDAGTDSGPTYMVFIYYSALLIYMTYPFLNLVAQQPARAQNPHSPNNDTRG